MAASNGDYAATLSIGLLLPEARVDVSSSLRNAQQDGFDFTTSAATVTTTRTDVLDLRARWWRTSVVGVIDDAISMNGLDFCHHMQLPAVILPELTAQTDVDLHKFAASVSSALAVSSPTTFWIPVPLSRQGLERWHLFYRLAGRHPRISILLVLQTVPTGETIPTGLFAQQLQVLHIFLGESVAAIALSTDLFLTNKRGYPTLAKSHQLLLTQLFTRIGRTVKVLLMGPGRHSIPGDPDASGVTGCLMYRQYIQHLRDMPLVKNACDTQDAQVETDYLDSLQRPLQPLADHLEYEIYENFERDPVKYVRYQEAIQMALEDLLYYENRPTATVYVVGAGRGPLVSAAMSAFEALVSQRTNTTTAKLNIVVVEKNPSAVIILKSRAEADPQWQRYKDSLVVIQSDLRDLTLEICGASAADIVVSELLGSFGDNELSPECLDSFYAAPVCRPDTISIPTKYTSFLAPANSAKLHARANQQSLFPNEYETDVLGMQRAMETPYVVRTHACSQMSAEQECWTFYHPSSASPPLHSREAVLNFKASGHAGIGYGCGYGLIDAQMNVTAETASAELAWTCTGLLGTFSSDLYTGKHGQGTSRISIAPTNFSVGMFSWFPLYFPVIEPLLVPAGASLRAYIWRRQDVQKGKVWYEWSVAVHRDGELLGATAVHNPGGRSSFVSTK